MRSAILPLVLFLAAHSWAQKQCFYPNGLQAKNDFPCDTKAADGPCCGGSIGAFCLTNKLCKGPDGNTIRGSCTSADWSSPECPQFCLGAVTGGTDLVSCSNVTGSDTSYCCDGPAFAFCCDKGVARFDVLPSKPQVLARWDAKATQFVAVSQTVTATTSSYTSSTTSRATSSATTNPPVAATLSSSASQTAPPESTTIAQPPSLSTAAQAGIGVGAAFLALALAAVAYLLFKLRNKKAQLARLQQEQHQHQGGAGAVYDSAQLEGKVDSIARYQHPYEVDGREARFELGTDSGTTAGRGW